MSDMKELARRAMACKHWRWVPRMVDTLGRTVLAVDVLGRVVEWSEAPEFGGGRSEVFRQDQLPLWRAMDPWLAAVPDFSDSATLGCLLVLVRKAYGESFGGVGVVWFGGHGEWCVVAGNSRMVRHTADVIARGRTEVAALIAALESAP